MRIALGQIGMGFEEKEKAMTLCSRLLAEAKEKQVDFVIFPEMTLTGFTLNPETYGEDRKNSPSMAFFREEAKKNHVAICYGLPVYENGVATNHCIILDENGNQLADYAKIHPFSFGAEAKHYTGGNALQLCEVKGVPVAPLICYDLRFPEIFQIVSEQAKVIPVIASWPTARREHWMTLLKARAIENQCFILGVNRSGEGGGLSYIGDSMAVSPTGEVLAHVEGGNGLTIVDIDLSEADAYRNSFIILFGKKTSNRNETGVIHHEAADSKRFSYRQHQGCSDFSGGSGTHAWLFAGNPFCLCHRRENLYLFFSHAGVYLHVGLSGKGLSHKGI